MKTDLWQRRLGWLSLVAVILLCSPGAQSMFAAEDGPPDGPPPPRRERDERTFQLRIPEGMFDQGGGKYWLGVECREAPPELKSQLGLKDDEGLVVVHLVEDGPAAKAGLKRHDLVVSAGDKKLRRVPDLVDAVNDGDGKEISLKVLRSGKEQSIAVTPAERPRENRQFIARPGTGFIFAGGPPADLPENVTVSITRRGKEPAKISVARGEEKWEITDKEIDKLPEELRPQIQRMLGGPGPMPFMWQSGSNMPPMGGMQNGDFHPMPGFGPPPRDGDGPPPPRDGHDGPPPPRDGHDGPPPRDGGPGPGMMMQPGMVPPELMDRLDRLDRRLEQVQSELRRLQDGGPGAPPRMGPRGPGPDGQPGDRAGGPPPRDDRRDGPPPRDGRDGPPGRRGPPPGDRRGPPPDDADGHGPPGGPPPKDQ